MPDQRRLVLGKPRRRGLRSPVVFAGVLAAVGALTGCTTEADEGAPTPTAGAVTTSPASSPSAPAAGSPSIEVSVPPAADDVVPRVVAFDPCFHVVDSLIEQVGFDPSSRERNLTEVTSMRSLTKIGCTFRRTATVDGEPVHTGSLEITTSTDSLAKLSGNERNEVIDTAPINGRPALVYRPTQVLVSDCRAAVESQDGTLQITVAALPSPVDVPEPCEQIREVAIVIATALDKV